MLFNNVRQRRTHLRLRNAKIGSEIEEVVLNVAKQRKFLVFRAMGRDEAEHGIEFVHFTIGGHAGMVFRHPATISEARLARVARFRVNVGKVNHARKLSKQGDAIANFGKRGNLGIRY